jgi:hypothetical protein
MKYLILGVYALLSCTYLAHGQVKKSSILVAVQQLNGNWITTNYIEQLQKTKSPLEASKTGVYQLFINSKTIQKNSLKTDMWTINEGGYGFIIFFKSGIKKETWRTDWKQHANKEIRSTDIGLELNGKDTILVLYHYSSAKKLVDKTIFTKPNTPIDMDKNDFLGYQINATLFTGKYTVTDSAGKAIEAAFRSNGLISGFHDFNRFYIVNFSLYRNTVLDEVYLQTGDDEKFSYTFTVEGNTIKLYTLQKSNRSSYTKGALRYTLTKKE